MLGLMEGRMGKRRLEPINSNICLNAQNFTVPLQSQCLHSWVKTPRRFLPFVW